jgi:hypothetical protein
MKAAGAGSFADSVCPWTEKVRVEPAGSLAAVTFSPLGSAPGVHDVDPAREPPGAYCSHVSRQPSDWPPAVGVYSARSLTEDAGPAQNERAAIRMAFGCLSVAPASAVRGSAGAEQEIVASRSFTG